MKILFAFIITVVSVCQGFSQQLFITQGKIEFEKKVNLHKLIDAAFGNSDNTNAWMEQYKKSMPSHKSSYFDLYFNEDKTLYKPGREETSDGHIPEWLLFGNENIVFSDLKKDQGVCQKSIFEDKYLIQDSLRKVDWKFTSDTRNIAGFECHKAVGIVMDSVYVIAFYTDEIVTRGGPESFNNLPGMILGVAIPRLNTTWFATKLELAPVTPEQLIAPKKGKRTDNKSLQKILKEHLDGAGFNRNLDLVNRLNL
jgi:GLPGLI family protein